MVGVLTTLASAVVGLRGAVVLGLLAGALDLIPSLGPTAALLVAVSLAWFNGSAHLDIPRGWFTVLVIVIFNGIQLAENLWLQPRIIGRVVRLNAGLVFVAVVGALASAGALAALIIVPVLGSARVIGSYLHKRILGLPPWSETTERSSSDADPSDNPHPELGTRQADESRVKSGQRIAMGQLAPGGEMYRRILVPLDGSTLAEQAVPHAVMLSTRKQSEVLLIQVHEVILSGRAAAVIAERKFHYESQVYLDRIARRIREREIQARSVVAVGTAHYEILNFAREQGVDLIVMSKRGQSGVTRWLVGGVVSRVLRSTEIPVLAVPVVVGGSPDWRDHAYRRILVPLDGSSLAEGALSHAIAIIRKFRAELVLVQVRSTDGAEERHSSDLEPRPQESAEEDYLERVAQSVEKQGVRALSVELVGRPENEIASYSESNQVDLIVMSAQGKSNLPYWLLGSVAERVVRGVNVPVLITRDPDKRKGRH
jgi:nucleotide-binding universal stress UspA family protein